MAATVTLDSTTGAMQAGNDSPTAKRMTVGTLNLGNSYATGGVAVTAQMFAQNQLDSLLIIGAGGVVMTWDKSNMKVQAWRNKDPGAAGGADIPLPEVANAADLSAATFTARFVAFGR